MLWIFLNICIHEKCGGYYPFPPWDRNTRGGGGFMTKTAIHAKQRLTRSSQTAMIMLDLHQRWLSITLWLFATWSLYYNACPSFKQRLTQRSSTSMMIMLDLCHIMMWWLFATWNFYDTLSAIHSRQRPPQRSNKCFLSGGIVRQKIAPAQRKRNIHKELCDFSHCRCSSRCNSLRGMIHQALLKNTLLTPIT